MKSVVYLDQRLDAAHPKWWTKSSFSAFFCAIKLKKLKKVTILVKNLAKDFKFAPKRWSKYTTEKRGKT